MNRKTFLKNSLGGIALTTVIPTMAFATIDQEIPPLETSLVKEFVVAGHKNLGLLKEMLQKHPNLIYSRYDWGNGDFEEAIEGAGHLGNKEIATYLINQGARVNLFVLTMLGKTALVKAALETYPNLLYAKGPHGFTLLHHAEVGGNDSKELFEYLTKKGVTEKHIDIK